MRMPDPSRLASISRSDIPRSGISAPNFSAEARRACRERASLEVGGYARSAAEGGSERTMTGASERTGVEVWQGAGLITVETAAAAIRRGEMVVALDGFDRHLGSLVVAAQMATPDTVNFMVKHARGLLSVAMLEVDLDRLEIPTMTYHATNPWSLEFHMPVDHATLATTGISAADRANTIMALADPASEPSDFTGPGHVVPVAPREGVRGFVEASIELVAAAGLRPAAAIIEILGPDGGSADAPELLEFVARHNLSPFRIGDPAQVDADGQTRFFGSTSK